MRDDDRRPALRELPKALEDGVLGLGVERRRRLVEDEDVRLLAHEGAREGDLLPLAAGELRPVLEPAPERRVEPAGERRHEVARAAALDRALDPRSSPRCSTLPKPTFSRTLSWYWLKSWKTTPKRARRASVPVAKVAAVEEDATLGRLVEARQELDERRLARAVLADEREALALRDREVDVPERPRLLARVAKADVLEDDAACGPAAGAGAARGRSGGAELGAIAGTRRGSTCRGCARRWRRSPRAPIGTPAAPAGTRRRTASCCRA